MSSGKLIDTLQVGGRTFQIETYLDDMSGEIVSVIAEDGRKVDLIRVPVNRERSERDVERQVRQVHRSTAAEWSHLAELYQKSIRSRHGPSALHMGIVLLDRGLYAEAIECLEQAVQWSPGNEEAHLFLGRAYIAAKMYSDAAAVLEEAVQNFPDNREILLWHGVALYRMRRLDEAKQVFEKILDAGFSTPVAHLFLAKTLLDLADLEKETTPTGASEDTAVPEIQRHVLAELQRAVEISGELDTAELRNAIREVKRRDFLVASSLLEELVLPLERQMEVFPSRFYVEFLFGGKSKDDAFVDEYIAYLTKKLEEQPNYPDLYNQLGIAYLIRCRNTFFKSLEQFRKALKINPQFSAARRNLKLAENEGKGFIILLRAILR
jgi:tetratricopeptide (TPR) repeat protein